MAALDPSVVINIAAEYTGKKAFTQADKATQQLSKSVKNLAKGFGLIFGVQAAKQAVRAFAADDKAARTLSKTLDNLGLAFADPATKVFIADLERQYGVLDDQLRPAFQKLITTTGDFNKSQDLLKTALDLSAMSGIDVVSVAGDLSKAYAGNTRGLMKYGLGISKAELATMNFDEILTQVAKVSSGQAQLAADTLSGSMAKLSVASANAAESLGKDLIQALTTLGGEGGLPKTLGLIESIASAIGDATVGFSRLIRQIDIITSSGSPVEMFKRLAAFRKEYQAQDAAQRLAERGGGGFSSYNAKKAADALAAKAAKTQLTSFKKLTAAQAAANKLAKAKAIFDLQNIQIAAALKGKISDEDKIRLKLMQAIQDENLTAIDKFTKALDEAQKKTKELQTALELAKVGFGDPFVAAKKGTEDLYKLLSEPPKYGIFGPGPQSMFPDLNAFMKAYSDGSGGLSYFNPTKIMNTVPATNGTVNGNMVDVSGTGNNASNAASTNVVNNNITVNGAVDAVGTANYLKQIIAQAANQVGSYQDWAQAYKGQSYAL